MTTKKAADRGTATTSAKVPATEPAGGPLAADSLSYEQARAELASVVDRLESGGTTLEESLALWERGEQLAAACQRWLDGARQRLDAARGARATG